MSGLNHLVIIFRYLVLQFLLLIYNFLNFFGVLPPKTKKNCNQVTAGNQKRRIQTLNEKWQRQSHGHSQFRACV